MRLRRDQWRSLKKNCRCEKTVNIIVGVVSENVETLSVSIAVNDTDLWGIHLSCRSDGLGKPLDKDGYGNV